MCFAVNLFAAPASAISFYEAQQAGSTPAPVPDNTDTSKGIPYTVNGQTYSYQGEKIKVVYESERINQIGRGHV